MDTNNNQGCVAGEAQASTANVSIETLLREAMRETIVTYNDDKFSHEDMDKVHDKLREAVKLTCMAVGQMGRDLSYANAHVKDANRDFKNMVVANNYWKEEVDRLTSVHIRLLQDFQALAMENSNNEGKFWRANYEAREASQALGLQNARMQVLITLVEGVNKVVEKYTHKGDSTPASAEKDRLLKELFDIVHSAAFNEAMGKLGPDDKAVYKQAYHGSTASSPDLPTSQFEGTENA